MNDARYPWFILVPQREHVREICDLTTTDQHALMDESSYLARAMIAAFSPDKLNIAAIGNIVRQLHVHHIARYRTDAAWPKPVWGLFAPAAYTEATREDVAARLLTVLNSQKTGFRALTR